MGIGKALAVLAIFILLAPAFAARDPNDYPGGSSTGVKIDLPNERCVMDNQYCFDASEQKGWLETFFAGEGPLSEIAKSWAETSWSKQMKDTSFIDSFYGLVGFSAGGFDKICKTGYTSAEVVKWVFFFILMIFFIMFVLLSHPSPWVNDDAKGAKKFLLHEKVAEGTYEFIEGLCKQIDDSIDVDKVMGLKPVKLLQLKFKASQNAAAGFMWKDQQQLPQEEARGGSKGWFARKAQGATSWFNQTKFGKRIDGIGGNTSVQSGARGMIEAFQASAVIDVMELASVILVYLLPTLIFSAILWVIVWIITGVAGIFEAGSGVACGNAFMTMLFGMFWAYWMWEIIRLILVKGAFLISMIVPQGLLKLIYIPFVGGDIGTRGMGLIMIVLGILGFITQGVTGSTLAMLSIIFLIGGLSMLLLNVPVAIFPFQLFGMAWLASMFKPLQYGIAGTFFAFVAAVILYAMLLVVFIAETIILNKTVGTSIEGVAEGVVGFRTWFKQLLGKRDAEPQVPEVREPELVPESELKEVKVPEALNEKDFRTQPDLPKDNSLEQATNAPLQDETGQDEGGAAGALRRAGEGLQKILPGGMRTENGPTVPDTIGRGPSTGGGGGGGGSLGDLIPQVTPSGDKQGDLFFIKKEKKE